MEKYYRVRKLKNPDANGICVKVEEGKLETFAGKLSPSDFGCFVEMGEMKVKKGYFLTEIDEFKAERLKMDYDCWTKMQLWAGTDPISIAIKSELAYKGIKR